jgi:secondary thiamine-phosphate synthase enzyme
MSTCVKRTVLKVKAPRRGLFEITDRVAESLPLKKDRSGNAGAFSFVHLFLKHTSAGLTIQENADPSARHDLELFFERLVPFGQPGFQHTMEGPDDMPSHIKTVLMDNSLMIPASEQGMMLGTWQGIYLWEHRDSCPTREIVLSVLS